MSNVFNNYFTCIAKKTNSNINFLVKHYTDYLSYSNTNTFFLTPTDKNEISLIISSLDSHKSSGPNSIPVKILKLLKNDISQQLSYIFNMSFSTGQFPSVLKIAKAILYIKCNQELIIQIIDQYPSYLILKRLLKNSCTKGYLIF